MLIAILGCSGSGKTLLTNILVQKFNFVCPTHTTTRKPRNDDNNFYKYVDIPQFLYMLHNQEFFIASGDGIRYYGIEKHELSTAMAKGANIVINISIKDLKQISQVEDVFVIMIKHHFFVTNIFTKSNMKKYGAKEIMKRSFIYIHDVCKYKRYIKEVVHYTLNLNSIPKFI